MYLFPTPARGIYCLSDDQDSDSRKVLKAMAKTILLKTKSFDLKRRKNSMPEKPAIGFMLQTLD